jgi:hypothetical protein
VRHILSCWYGTTSFFTRPKHDPWHGGTFSCCVGPSTTSTLWLLMTIREHNIIVLWMIIIIISYIKVDFMFYLYDTNYTKLYNRYDEWLGWYNLRVCHWTIFMSCRPKHDRKCVVLCYPLCWDLRHDTVLTFVLWCHSPKFIVSCQNVVLRAVHR